MIPTNLDECFEELKSILSTEVQIAIIKMPDGPIGLHHGVGTWLRNNWKLWQPDSVLSKYFQTLGLHHADDMSGLILDSFWHHLRSEPLDIEGQVKKYKEYWNKQNGS